MGKLRIALFALMLSVPALAFAESAHGESTAHEVAEHEAGHDADAHGGHGELTLKGVLTNHEFWGTLVNFGALLVLFGWVLKKKGNPALAERRKQVEAELQEAKRLRAEAEKRHMETATRLEKLDEEMLQIRADMVKAGEAERDRIVADAEEKAARMRKDTRFLIEQQMKQLREDLTREAASAAVVAAQDLLQKGTTDADQDRLADAYLDRLDEVIEERRS
jgi:F-type H+-transporting ATPase subunit b